MRNYYKISEISKLYNIGPDSLRYYERIGLLNPQRGENNYRLYSLHDLYRLNIIRELRPLNFSMEQIKDYTNQLSIDNSLKVFGEERENIKEQIQNLLTIDQSLQERINSINQSLAHPIDTFQTLYFPDRPCVLLNANIRRDEEADFAIQKLHQKYENKIYNLGKHPIGSSLELKDLQEGREGLFRTIFYVLEPGEDSDFILHKGNYLSLFYAGDYSQSPTQVDKLLVYAKGEGLELDSDIYEIYHIDNRYTVKPEEFLTEVQVKIK